VTVAGSSVPVPVVGVGPVDVDMVHLLVGVFVAVGPARFIRVNVGMVDVVMNVHMVVDHPQVFMVVAVLFPDDDRDAQGHERGGRKHEPLRCLPEDDE
jgi:hypothetical protein